MEENTSPTQSSGRNKYRGSFSATYFFVPLAILACDAVGLDEHVLTKELAIRWVEHRSEIHSNEFQHLTEGTEVARLRWRFSCVVQQALSFCTRHHLCRQEVALAGTGKLRSQGRVSLHAHCTERVTGLEGQKRANGVENMNGDGDGAGTGTGVEASERTQDGNGSGGGAGTGTGTRMVVETRGRKQDGNEDGSGDGNGCSSGDGNGDGSGDGNGCSKEDGNGDGDGNGTELGGGRGDDNGEGSGGGGEL